MCTDYFATYSKLIAEFSKYFKNQTLAIIENGLSSPKPRRSEPGSEPKF